MTSLMFNWRGPTNLGPRYVYYGFFVKPCFIFEQQMGKKHRRKVDKTPRTNEQIATATNDVIRLQDRVGVPETTHSIAQTIRKNVRSVQQGVITRKHIARMLQYRISQSAGMTHDIASRNLPDCFVTPLTRLQHEAQLPTTLDTPRHPFPHVIRYTVDWLATASPSDEHKNSKITVSFNMKDLGLSSRQIKKMKEILGEDRYDDDSGVAILQGDIFDNLNANAHYLGRSYQNGMGA
ncbi:hypothetical protein X943_000680 [Babesia divergens]|uniref:Small ribosomal subunit protein mS35 mitochondrial conserved domain-containing protein n=1 Tax=Babesia divergens TaxID=32595 RepID=A0AAD9G6H6_BABDI|nr:hypothetical protein X943_000680 [Babesia divergens]